MAADRPLVAFVGRGREPALVARVRVDLKIELEHLGDAPRLGLVGLLRVEVQQEPLQALAAAALGRHIVVHPRAGVAHRGKRAAALAFVVVVEADGVGLAPALGDIRPRGSLRPGSSHRCTSRVLCLTSAQQLRNRTADATIAAPAARVAATSEPAEPAPRPHRCARRSACGLDRGARLRAVDGLAHRVKRAATCELLAYPRFHPQGASRDEPTEAIWPGQDPKEHTPELRRPQAARVIGTYPAISGFLDSFGYFPIARPLRINPEALSLTPCRAMELAGLVSANLLGAMRPLLDGDFVLKVPISRDARKDDGTEISVDARGL
jgi:hypothetical protein